MNPAVRRRRLEALHGLSARLGVAAGKDLLAEAVEALLEASPCRGAAAFALESALELVAERGFPRRGPQEPIALRRALAALAERGATTRRALLVADLRSDREGIDDAGEILALGAHAAYALPVLYTDKAVGALVLLLEDAAQLDEEAGEFVATVAQLLAPFLGRSARHESERPSADEVAEASRMASLGLLTASVAHELRGPAGALVLQQEELARLVEQALTLCDTGDSVMQSVLGELNEVTFDIKTAIQRVRDTIEQLSTVSRREPAPECIDLSAAVRESLTVAMPQLERRGIRLTTHFEPGCLVLGRRYSLGQVALNLTFNAMDACAEAPEPEIWVHVRAGSNEVVLSVEDNGPGIPTHAVEHIFKPFYTTKRPGQGTGLGLKICSDVVTAHGGHIEVHEREGGGASFRVLLSRIKDAPLRSAVPSSHVSRQSSTAARRIFLVDDDPVFSRSMRRSLKPHEVRTAAAASDAEVQLLDPSYAPDLVLCDVFLPGQNGHQLHERIAQRRPEIASRFVFVTGGALGRVEAEYLKASGCGTLFKPVELRTLVELLEGAPGEARVRTLSPPAMPPGSAPTHGVPSAAALKPPKSPVP